MWICEFGVGKEVSKIIENITEHMDYLDNLVDEE